MGDVSLGEKDASPLWAKFYAPNWSFRNKEAGKLKKRWIAIIVTVVVLLTTTLIMIVAYFSGLLDKGPRSLHSENRGSSDDSDGLPDPDGIPKPFVAKLAHLVQPL